MMICKKCALENEIVRIRGSFEMGFCSCCCEFCVVYTVLKGENTKRAQALAEAKRSDK